MLRIAFSVFGVLAIANNALAQQYTDNATRNKAIQANSVKQTPVKAVVPAKPANTATSIPVVNLPSVRPAQQNPNQQAQTAPKTGTVLANISVNPQKETERVPFSSSSKTAASTTERVSTQTRQEADGRISTKTTKTVTTVRPDGVRQVATTYNTRVSMSSSPAKTSPVKTNAAPTAPSKIIANAPVTVTTVKPNSSKTAATPVIPKSAENATSFTDLQRSAASTGSSAAYLSTEEKNVLLLINLVRADGAVFLKEYVDKYIKANTAFQNNSFAQSLYNDLKKVKGLPPLRPNMKLCNSARAHAQDIGQKGMRGHQSSNGMKFDTRVARYVGGYRGLGENISYGSNHNAAIPVVLELLIDNNNKDFGHRRNILSPSFETIGISIQSHSKYGYTCVQDFGSGVE